MRSEVTDVSGGKRFSPGLPEPLPAALIVAMCVACADILLAVPRAPESWTTWAEILPPLAIVAALSLVMFLSVWYGVIRPAGRRLALRERDLLPAFGVFSCAAFAALSAQGLLRPDLFSAGLLPGSLTALLAAAALGHAAYAGLRRRRSWRLLSSAGGRLATVSPAALLLAVVASWYFNPQREPLLSPVSAATASATVALTALGWLLFRGSRRSVSVVLPVLFLALLVAGGLALVWRDDFLRIATKPATAGGHPLRHVILISADSLRADALSCYGTRGTATRRIDELAADSVLFRHAYSSASWTLPAAASLLTGLPPYAHQVFWMETRLPDEIPTLADLMSSVGYATAAITENPVLDPRLNLYKGFQELAHLPKPWPWSDDALGRQLLTRTAPSRYYRGGTEVVTRAATGWLERNQDRDFFLWVHYFDPHAPYSPPKRFLPARAAPASIGDSFDQHVQVVAGTRLLTAEEREWVRELYLAEVRYVDEQVGILMDTLKRLGIYDEALIVLTSDHGEEFWEHGAYQHGHSMYDEVIAVPLLVKFPQARHTGSFEERVSTEFVKPTILELCGVTARQSCYSAPSLAGLVSGNRRPGGLGALVQAGSCYHEEMEAVIFNGNYKLIRRLGSLREELFDLRKDPEESRSMLDSLPAKAELGRRTLDQFAERLREVRSCYQANDRPAPAGSRERLRQLRSLGYLD